MISKPAALSLLAIACVTAAAGGAYVAVRRNHPTQAAVIQSAERPQQGVAETEAVVDPSPAIERVTPASSDTVARTASRVEPAAHASKDIKPKRDSQPVLAGKPAVVTTPARVAQPAVAPEPAPVVAYSAPSREPSAATSAPARAGTLAPEPSIAEASPAPAKPVFVEVVVPASSVVGLNVVTSLTSETARVEDRVEARVTRDVLADGRVAIPAGTRVIGDVTLVERGGKMKDKARLGVRFHTLVLADGNQIPFRTDAIFRDGASPGNESARKIGGAAIGGAILGAIIGGAKGAAIGGATGAAGGSAVVMAGDRNAATLPAGTIVTVRLSSPVSIDVEREQ